MEYFISVHNAAVEDKKKFILGSVTVTDDNDYISYLRVVYIAEFTGYVPLLEVICDTTKEELAWKEQSFV